MPRKIWYLKIIWTFLEFLEFGNFHHSTLVEFDPELARVSVQGVESLGGHFATLCWEFDFYDVKKILLFFKRKREILLDFYSFL